MKYPHYLASEIREVEDKIRDIRHIEIEFFRRLAVYRYYPTIFIPKDGGFCRFKYFFSDPNVKWGYKKLRKLHKVFLSDRRKLEYTRYELYAKYRAINDIR